MTYATPKNFDEKLYWKGVYHELSQYFDPIPKKEKVKFERFKKEIMNLSWKSRIIFYHQSYSIVAKTIYKATKIIDLGFLK